MTLAIVTLDFLAKLLVIAVFTPMWLPIVKEIWNEINESLVEDGGLMGKDVDQAEVDRVLRERRQRGASLISERSDGAGGAPRSGTGARSAGAKRPAPKKRGF